MKALVIAILLVLPAAAGVRTIEASDPVQVTALAVAEVDGSFVGVAASVHATAMADGAGQVFVDTKPLAQTDMQGSARQATRVAADLLGLDWRDYDVTVVFRSGSTVIGGPSAGAVMTLALATALWNLENPDDPWVLDSGVAATGTVNPDGTIGPVGGIPAKAEAAAARGIRLFLYPAGLDQAVTLRQGQAVLVDMADHCASLGITCRSAATVADLVEAAAGVRVQAPPAPTPATADYEALIGPDVEAEVAALATRIAAVGGTSEALQSARERLAQAEQALAADRFYTAATRAFQGHIDAAYAENLTALEPTMDEAVVVAALGMCEDSLAAAEAAAGRRADDMHGLYAIGAAQRRAIEAARLSATAEAAYQQAFAAQQWTAALAQAAFCTERAHTAVWWAGLADLFGPSPAFAEALLTDTMDEAREAVAYAQAVLGGEAAGALEALAEADAHAAAGRIAGALLAAVEAQVQASVAVQTVTGAAVPQEVLAAAREGAHHAIARARAAGTEPVLAVSLVELAEDTPDTTLSLTNLWTARSAALLSVQEPAPAPAVFPAPSPTAVPLLLVAGGIGFAVGALVVAAVILTMVRERRQARLQRQPHARRVGGRHAPQPADQQARVRHAPRTIQFQQALRQDRAPGASGGHAGAAPVPDARRGQAKDGRDEARGSGPFRGR